MGVSEWVSAVAQSCPTLFDPMDCVAQQAPPSMEFSRQAYWSGLQCGSIAILIRKSVLIQENRMNLSVYLVFISYLSTTFYSSQSKSFAILLLSFIPKFFFQCYYKWNCFLNLVFFDTTDTKNYNFFGSLILYKNTIDFVYRSCILEHCPSSNSFFQWIPYDFLYAKSYHLQRNTFNSFSICLLFSFLAYLPWLEFSVQCLLEVVKADICVLILSWKHSVFHH